MFTLFKKTIASVVADLEQKVTDLEKLEEQHLANATAHAKAAYESGLAQIEHSNLAVRAKRIAAKVKELIA